MALEDSMSPSKANCVVQLWLLQLPQSKNSKVALGPEQLRTPALVRGDIWFKVDVGVLHSGIIPNI